MNFGQEIYSQKNNSWFYAPKNISRI